MVEIVYTHLAKEVKSTRRLWADRLVDIQNSPERPNNQKWKGGVPAGESNGPRWGAITLAGC